MVGQGLTLGLILDTQVTADGSLLMIDRSVSKVFRIDATGKVINSYGGSGGGPGEFNTPYRVTELSDGSVIVYDLANQRFSEFTRNGKFVKRWATSVSIVSLNNIVPLAARQFAFSGIVRDSRAGNKAVHVFDSTFQLIRSFGELPRHKSRNLVETWGGGGLGLSPEGLLIHSRHVPYELRWYTQEGIQRRRVVVAKRISPFIDDAFAVTTAGETVTMRSSGRAVLSGTAAALPDGRILAGRGSRSSSEWDVLSPTGTVVWSGPKPERVRGYIGEDKRSARLWFSGETESGEPVLYRVMLADNHR
jgi:hypothetical protein